MAKQKMKTVDMSVKVEDLDKKTAASVEIDSASTKKDKEQAAKPTKKVHTRSSKYQVIKAKVDRTKNYPLKQASDMVINSSYSKFPGTIVADLVVKDEKVTAEVDYPFSTGKTVRIAVVTDALIKEIEAGKIDFDILVTSPEFMPKIAKLAKVLGPKGLMPNPKNGTVVANPEKRAKELASGKTTIKTERKSPLIHAIVGKTTQPASEIVANVTALIKAIGTTKINKVTLSATMSPGIKVDYSKFSD